MKKADLKDVLELVKNKLSRDVEAGCGIFWADEPDITTLYSVGEEDGGPDQPTPKYAIGEEG